MQLQAQQDIHQSMEKYISARTTNPRGYPIQQSIFTDYKCKSIHTGLRDCAMHQPEWPVEVDQGTHCNRLLHFINETYFQDQMKVDPTTGVTTTTSPYIVASRPVYGLERGSEAFVPESNPLPEYDGSTRSPDKGEKNEKSEKSENNNGGSENVYYFILGFVLGILFYVVSARILKIVLGLSPVLNIHSGSDSSTAFFYVSTTPSTVLKKTVKPLLSNISTPIPKSSLISNDYGDNTV